MEKKSTSGAVSPVKWGDMLTEVEAPDQPTLERFYQSRYVDYEWIMRIDQDARDGTVREY